MYVEKELEAHSWSCSSLVCVNDDIVSCGLDGRIMYWKLNKKEEVGMIELEKSLEVGLKMNTMCHIGNDKLLIGGKGVNNDVLDGSIFVV